jgi:serine/threonine-protein kinase
MQESLTLFDIMPGKKLGERFLVQGTSRQGGLSAVFSVLDEKTDTECELQLFPGGLFDEPGEAEDFVESWARWQEVNSPLVAKVFEVVDLGAAKALVTEAPRGRSLRELFDEGRRFNADEVVAVGLELCGGLSALHGRGLAHGDVKPKTIFIDEHDGCLDTLMVDGGVTAGLWAAKHLGEHTALIGTPFYAPIEQFGGTAPDARSDVYNTAAVLYELCCGVLPWRGKSFLDIFQAKLAKDVPPMALRAPDIDVPEALEAAIVAGLAGDRNLRYPDAIRFGAALADLA